jgi:hypothetical protein
MRQKKSWLIVGVILVVTAVNLVLAPGAWAASTLKLLHLFTGGVDGAQPGLGRLISTRPGIFNSTTIFGGSFSYSSIGCGRSLS